MTCGSDLPPELIAHILDSLYDGQSTLRQCSLVCRAWVSPSQRPLFRKFKIGAHRANILQSDLLVGAPHLGTYIQEISFLGPDLCRQDAGDKTATREDIQSLFSFLPNTTAVHALWLRSSPFLFTNGALRQCPQLRQFSIVGAHRPEDVVSPTSIFPSFDGTTVKDLNIENLNIPSTMDSPPNLLCAIERLSLYNVQAHNFAVWLPYFKRVLPQWNKLKVTVMGCDSVRALPLWSHLLRTRNRLAGLNQLHFHVRIHTTNAVLAAFPPPIMQFPRENTFSLPPSEHLLLTATLFSDYRREILHRQSVFDMVQYYLCTLRAFEKSTLKKLTLTVVGLEDRNIAAAWAKVDNTLSLPTFSSLEQVDFLDIAGCSITTQSKPKLVRRLQDVLPKLWSSKKLAV